MVVVGPTTDTYPGPGGASRIRNSRNNFAGGAFSLLRSSLQYPPSIPPSLARCHAAALRRAPPPRSLVAVPPAGGLPPRRRVPPGRAPRPLAHPRLLCLRRPGLRAQPVRRIARAGADALRTHCTGQRDVGARTVPGCPRPVRWAGAGDGR